MLSQPVGAQEERAVIFGSFTFASHLARVKASNDALQFIVPDGRRNVQFTPDRRQAQGKAGSEVKASGRMIVEGGAVTAKMENLFGQASDTDPPRRRRLPLLNVLALRRTPVFPHRLFTDIAVTVQRVPCRALSRLYVEGWCRAGLSLAVRLREGILDNPRRELGVHVRGRRFLDRNWLGGLFHGCLQCGIVLSVS